MTSGNVFCWGWNTYGQIGIGGVGIQDSPNPIQVIWLNGGKNSKKDEV
jgi:alpha-tubulin suppressor-like RCC1 family protein